MNRILRSAGHPIVAYDLVRELVVSEITDYAYHLQEEKKLGGITIDATLNHVIRFVNYLFESWIGRLRPRNTLDAVNSLSDVVIERFRDLELRLVLENPRSFRVESVAKATVNSRLAAVYRWIWWLKEHGIIKDGLIGPSDCAVTLRLKEPYRVGFGRSRHSSKVLHTSLNMPLLYRDAQGGGKHDSGFVPSRMTADDSVALLISRNSSEFKNLRDALIVDIAVETGFRVASIASLLVTDFNRKAIENHQGVTYPVCPKIQKLSYSNTFHVPIWLALRVCEFLDVRERFIKEKYFDMKFAESNIFISERDGKPLKSRSISQLIGRILRGLGAPKGVSIHSFRRLFCTEAIEDEINDRVRLGLDTSTASVSAAIALKMGHSDPMSFFPYVSRAMSKKFAEERAKVRRGTR